MTESDSNGAVELTTSLLFLYFYKIPFDVAALVNDIVILSSLR